MRRPLPLLLATLAAGVVAPSSATAALVPPTAVGTRAATAVNALHAGAATDGSAAVAYERGGVVYAALKASGAVFAAPVELGTGAQPALAVAADGRAAVTWIAGTGAGAVVHTAIRAPGAAAFAELATAPAAGATLTSVHIADDGRIYVGWASTTGATLLSYAPGATAVTGGTTISGTVTGVAVGTQTGGIGWLLTTQSSGSTTTVVAARWSSASGASAPKTLESKTTSGSPPFTTSYAETAPAVLSGDHPSFLWSRGTYSSFPGSFNPNELVQVAEPIPATPVPATLHTLTTGIASTAVRSTVSSATDATGAGLVGFGASTGLGMFSHTLTLLPRTAAGGFDAALTLPALTTAFDGTSRLTGTALTATGGGAARIAYADSAKLFTAPVTAQGTVGAAGATTVPVATGESIFTLDAAGTGSGDTLVAYGVGSASANYGVQVALDDVTPPTLVVPEPARPAPPTGLDAAAAQAYNQAQRTQSFSATAVDAWTPTTLTWDFGDGATATGAVVSHTFAAAGTVQVKVTATDLAGNATTRTLSWQILSVPVPPVPTPAPVPPTPTLSAAKLSKKTLTTTGKKKGATITFTLSAAATVELGVTRTSKGYGTAKSCKAKAPKGTKKPKRCTLRKALGTRTFAGRAGVNTFSFDGKAAGKALKPGTYELTLGPKPALANHATASAVLRFTVKKA